MQAGSFVRTELLADRPPPSNIVGLIPLMRQRLFDGWFNILLTLLSAAVLFALVPPLVRFMFIDAVWTGTGREACVNHAGACWPFIWAKLGQFIYGFYPAELRWRPNLVFAAGAALLVPLLIPGAPLKKLNAILFFGLFPLFAFVMLTGGDLDLRRFLVGRLVDLNQFVGLARLGGLRAAFWLDYFLSALLIMILASLAAWVIDASVRALLATLLLVFSCLAFTLLAVDLDFMLRPVETRAWGGLLVTLVVAITGIVASLPLGILLALGRRSEMPIVRFASVAFIEFWRGVPLVTVLFFATYMLPLFLPGGVNFDGLLRALVGVTLFASAYMAEVIRGGLQAIPRGQYEGAQALGLHYWQIMSRVVLPQALVIVIPGIVNSFIALFKDTTLVLIVSIFDLLGQLRAAFTDPNWATPTTVFTGFAFAGVIYFVFCFSMSRYALYLERRAAKGRR
jgi:general L-amino acid transport system permease protein